MKCNYLSYRLPNPCVFLVLGTGDPSDVKLFDGKSLIQSADDLGRRCVVKEVRIGFCLVADRNQGVAELVPS